MRSRAFAFITLIGTFCLGGTLLGCAGDSEDGSGGGPSGSGASGGTPTGDGGTPGSGGDGTGGLATGGASTGGDTSSGGADPSSGGSGGGGETVDCSNLPLCTDFEGDAVGAVPAGFTANLNYNSGTNPGNVAVTSEAAHSGSQSVKVIGTEGLYGIEYAAPGDSFYLRTWLKVDGLTNGNPAIVGVGQGNNDEMRMRLVKKGVNDFHAVAANAAAGDGLSPPNSSGGLACDDCVPMPADWFCLEMHVDRAAQTLQMWVDGEQAVNIVNNEPWSGGANWPASMDVLRIGSMALEGGGATVYIDDVALGPSRIGCD